MSNVEPRRLAYRPTEAATILGVGRTKMFDWIKRGIIKTRLIDGVRLVPASELERLLADAS